MGGVEFFTGCTGAGKTFLAEQHLRTAIIENGYPGLVLDMVGCENFRDMAHEKSVDDALSRIYGNPRRNAVYRPKDEKEVDALARAIGSDELGAVNVLIDESFWCFSAHHISTDLSRALRSWRHHRLGPLSFFLTTQRPADLHGDARAAYSAFYVFRPSPGRDVERLRQDFGLDPDRMLSLKAREYILIRNEIAA
jgi:hypothetical protein